MKRSGLWMPIIIFAIAGVARGAEAAPQDGQKAQSPVVGATPSGRAPRRDKPDANANAQGTPQGNAPVGARGDNAPGPDEGVPQFQPPPVSDPMLAPPPAAKAQVTTWDEALGMIRARSPDYLSNFESVKRAEAQTRVALAQILPNLNATGSYTHQFEQFTFQIGNVVVTTPPANVLTAAANLSWSVINPRGLYGVGTAKKNVAASKLDFEERRRTIAITVANTMLQTLATERIAELNRTGLRTALERLALAQKRFEFGRGTQLDTDRGEQDVENARSQLLQGDETLRQARENLGVALGSATPVSAPGKLDLAGFEDGVAKTCRLNEELERRPDVWAARTRVELAERAIKDVELQFAPSVAVLGTASKSNVAVLGPDTLVTFQGVLTVPLYDGGSRYGQLRATRAAAEQARQALTALRLNAVVESSRSKRAVTVTKDTRDVAQKQRDLAARVDARTRDGYAQGQGTSLDLVTSAQALRQAEINLALLEFQYAQARIAAVLANAECVY